MREALRDDHISVIFRKRATALLLFLFSGVAFFGALVANAAPCISATQSCTEWINSGHGSSRSLPHISALHPIMS